MLAVLLTACTLNREDNLDLETVTLCLPSDPGWTPVTVELAVTPAQRQQGLQGRTELPEDQGMLFLYRQEQGARNAFWMYRTPIPLDIAWLDEDGRIARTSTMVPCLWETPARCQRYPAGVPYRAALEVPAGRFVDLGLSTGARIRVNDAASGESACSRHRGFEALLDQSS